MNTSYKIDVFIINRGLLAYNTKYKFIIGHNLFNLDEDNDDNISLIKISYFIQI